MYVKSIKVNLRLDIYKGRKISNCAGGRGETWEKNLNCNQRTWVLATTYKPDFEIPISLQYVLLYTVQV